MDPMLETHEFVQKIEKSKGPTGQIPAIILYSENQMKDFEMFVKNSDKPRVGIDRTFNLGCFFVTSIVYKNTRVVRRETNDHPICLGPILSSPTYSTKANFEMSSLAVLLNHVTRFLYVVCLFNAVWNKINYIVADLIEKLYVIICFISFDN
jgi:hypothetical protein